MLLNCLPCGRVGLFASQMKAHVGSVAHIKRMGERNSSSPGYCVQCTRDCGTWSNLQKHLGGADHRKVIEFLGLEVKVIFKVPQVPAPKRRCLDSGPCFESTRVGGGLLNETYVLARPKFPTPEVITIEDTVLEEPPLVIVLEDTIVPQIEEVPPFPRIRHYNVDLDASEYDE